MYISFLRAHHRSALYPVAAFSAAQLCAQVPEEHLVLDPLFVVANQRPLSVDDVPLPVSVLDAEDLRLSQAATLGETLAHEPGVSSSSFGAGSSRPIIRGLGDQRVIITEAGLDAFDVSDTSPDHAVALEPLLAEEVRIVRGPASLLYGSSAVGGVVDVDAGDIPDSIPQDTIEAMVHGRAESGNDGFATAARLTSKASGNAFRVQGLLRDTEDYRLPNDIHRHIGDLEADHDNEVESPAAAIDRLPNSQVATRSLAAGWRSFFTGATVGGAASFYRSEYGVPGHNDHHDHDHGHEEEHGGPEHQEEDEAVTVHLERIRARVESSIDDPAPGLENLMFRFAWGDYWHKELHGDSVETRFDRVGWEARVEALHSPILNLAGVVGLQASDSAQSSIGLDSFAPPSDTRNYAVFAVEELDLRDSLLIAGLRLEHQDISVPAASSGYSDETASGAVSIIHPMGSAWRVGGSISLTSRHPTATELFANGPHAAIGLYEVGDSSLRSESARGAEIFIRRVKGPITGSLNIFHTSFHDFIYLQETAEQRAGVNVARFVANDVTFYGAELDVQWSPLDWLMLNAGGDFVRSENRETNQPLPRIPPARSWLGLELSSGDWAFETRWVHAFRQDQVVPAEDETPGYDDISLKIERTLFDGDLHIYALLANILDDVQLQHTSFLRERAPRPGRTFTLGAIWTY